MRWKFQPIKDLRNRLLQRWWKYAGVGVARTSEDSFLDSSELLIQQGFHASTRTYPEWPMAGRITEVSQELTKCTEGELASTHCQDWLGKLTVEYPADFIAILPQASVLSRQGFVLSSQREELASLGGDGFDLVFPHQSSVPYVPRPRQVVGRLLNLTNDRSQRNYFHWTFEMLAQLRLLEEAGIAFDHVAVPARKSFPRESLKLIGISESQMIPMAHYTHLQADELIVLSRHGGYPLPSGVIFLRDSMRDKSWSRFDSPQRLRLYISRASCNSRRVTNEEQLLTALQPFGFQSVRLECLSVRQQIELFQQADIVVGPHGAGLTNSAFCRPGTAVIEISPTSRPCRYFHCISHINQLRFRVYFGRSIRRPGQAGTEADIEVDCQDLVAEVEYLLQGGEKPLARVA